MKKSIIFLLSTLLITPCFAEDTMNVDINVEDNIVKGFVTVPEALSSHELGVQIRDEAGNLNFFDVIYTNEKGEADFLYHNLGATGEYSVNVYSSERDESISTTFDYYDDVYRGNAITEFNKLCAENKSFSGFINTYKDMLDVSATYDKITDTVTFDEVFSTQQLTATNIKEIREIIDDNIVLTLVKKATHGDEIKELITGDYKKYSEFILDDEGNPLLFAFNEEVKNQFYADIANGEFTSKSELENGFKTALLTNAIEHANYYTEVMTALKAYDDAGWLNLSNTYSMEVISQALIGKSFSSLSDVERVYNGYQPIIIPGGSSGGGSSGGGTSGGSSFGGNVSGVTSYIPNSDSQTTIKDQENTFSDVDFTMWAAKDIEKAVNAGILSGMGDGSFNPTGNLTRAQAAVIMTKLAGLELSDKDFGFDDVNSEDWYYEYVGATCSAGIFYGLSDSVFGVNETLNREQAAVIFWRYLKNSGFEKKEKELDFEDSEMISNWAKEAVSSLLEYKVIAGKTDNLFMPDKPLLRAEAAVIISKILELTNANN